MIGFVALDKDFDMVFMVRYTLALSSGTHHERGYAKYPYAQSRLSKKQIAAYLKKRTELGNNYSFSATVIAIFITLSAIFN